MVDTTAIAVAVRRIAPDLLNSATDAVRASFGELDGSVAALRAIWDQISHQQRLSLIRALPPAPTLEFNEPGQGIHCAHPGPVLVTATISFDSIMCTHLTAVQPVRIRDGSISAVADIASLRVEERLVVGAIRGHVVRVHGHLYAGTTDVDMLYGGDVDAFEMRGLEAHLGRLRLRKSATFSACTIKEAIGPGKLTCQRFAFAA